MSKEILERLTRLEQENQELRAQLDAANKKIADLESKLADKNKDSHNSSKPPSKDPPEKQNKYPDRKKSNN